MSMLNIPPLLKAVTTSDEKRNLGAKKALLNDAPSLSLSLADVTSLNEGRWLSHMMERLFCLPFQDTHTRQEALAR